MGHTEVQRGDAHHGAGHITRVGTETRHGAGRRLVVIWGGTVGAPWSESPRERGGGAGGGELLALAALGHKAGDKAGDGVAASPALFGCDPRALAVLEMARPCPQ